MVSRNTTLVPSLGLRIGPACEAGLSADMRRERVSPQIKKKEKERRSDNSHFDNALLRKCGFCMLVLCVLISCLSFVSMLNCIHYYYFSYYLPCIGE